MGKINFSLRESPLQPAFYLPTCPVTASILLHVHTLASFVNKPFRFLLWLASFLSLPSIAIHLQFHLAACIKLALKPSFPGSRLVLFTLSLMKFAGCQET